jgi:hypothetical protein
MNQRIMARALGGAFVRHEHRSYVALQAGSRVYGWPLELALAPGEVQKPVDAIGSH